MTDYGQILIRKVHLCLRLRWAKKFHRKAHSLGHALSLQGSIRLSGFEVALHMVSEASNWSRLLMQTGTEVLLPGQSKKQFSKVSDIERGYIHQHLGVHTFATGPRAGGPKLFPDIRRIDFRSRGILWKVIHIWDPLIVFLQYYL